MARLQSSGGAAAAAAAAAAGTQQTDRRRDDRQRDERRRASQAGNNNQGGVVAPSPAMVRTASKQQGNIPNVLTPGSGTGPAQQGTPMSAAAQVGVPIGTPNRRMSQQGGGGGGGSHPYANAGYDTYGRDEYSASQQAQYGRTSPMVSTVGAGPVPPAVSNVGAMRGDANVANGQQQQQQQQQDEERPKLTLWKIITCSCG